MMTHATPPCPNCQRLQAEVDALRARPDDVARRAGSGVWGGAARGAAGPRRGDPPAGGWDGAGLPGPTGGGAGRGAAARDARRAGEPGQMKPGNRGRRAGWRAPALWIGCVAWLAGARPGGAPLRADEVFLRASQVGYEPG